MKKLVLAAALLAGTATAASAQSTIVKANIFSPFVHTGSFFLEQRVGARSSVQLGALYTRFGTDDTRIRGFALTPEYRFYLSDDKPALYGFYVAPFLRYQNLTATNDYPSQDGNGNSITAQLRATINTYGGGVLVGYQLLLRKRFSLDTFLGPSYNGGTLRLDDSNASSQTNFSLSNFRGYGVRAGVTFGVAF